MSMQEMWQWVHTCYGDELGLTSDDEDYIPPTNEDDKLSSISVRLSVDSFSEVSVRLKLFCHNGKIRGKRENFHSSLQFILVLV
jgi:hypothetical protein